MIDLIYLIILIPIVTLLSFAAYAIKVRNKRLRDRPEATPYVYERDAFQPTFDDFSKALETFKFYKGKK